MCLVHPLLFQARERARLWREKKRNELTCSLSPESLETIMNDRNETDRIRMQQWRDKKRKAATIDESSKKSNEQDAITSQWGEFCYRICWTVFLSI